MQVDPKKVKEWEKGESFPDDEKMGIILLLCDTDTPELEILLAKSKEVLNQGKRMARGSYKPTRKR